MISNLFALSLLAIPALAVPHQGRGLLSERQQQCTPSKAQVAANPKLPDPFTSASGDAVTTKADWDCRRQELFQQIQNYESGTKPDKPSTVTASYSGNKLSITCGENGKTISFDVTISGGGSSDSPVPGIIAYGYPSIPIPSGVATITFNNDDIAAQTDSSSRGKGKFYNLYGSDHTASAITAWAWAVSRIIDALEDTPAAGIKPARIGVTGCSRNGKGALFAGAFDDRVALTIPQESGSGGSACWRLSDDMRSRGINVQTAQEIVGENVWFSTAFEQYVNDVGQLPFDHHSIAGLVAPRGMFVIENTGMEWLGNWSCYGCMVTAHKVWEALGVPDHMGFSQVGGHNHCQFPDSQKADLNKFIDRFLLDKSADTSVMKTDGDFTFDESQWASWKVPTLS